MDIMTLVNSMQPNTIIRFGRSNKDWPGLNAPVPFLDGYAELALGATLPSENAVIAYESVYNAMLEQANIDASTKEKIPDLATQLASILIAKGTIAATDIHPETLDEVNVKLEESGISVITKLK